MPVRNSATVLDLEFPTVRALVGRGRSWGTVDLPEGAAAALLGGDAAPAKAAVGELLGTLGIRRGARVGLVVPNAAVMEQTVALPRVRPGERRAAMVDMARRQFGASFDGLHLFVRAVGRRAERGYLLGIKREQLAARHELLRALGLRPVWADVQSLCWARALRIGDGFVLHLDRGRTVTLVAYREGVPAESFSVQGAEGRMAADVAEAVQMLLDPRRLEYQGLEPRGPVYLLGEAGRWRRLPDLLAGVAPGLAVTEPPRGVGALDLTEYAAAWGLAA